jgi:hypothetical protein
MRIISRLLLASVLYINCIVPGKSGTQNQVPNRPSSDTIITTSVTIAGTGDIMFGSAYPSKSFLPPGNNSNRLIESLIDTLSSADLTFGNLEGSFLDYGEPYKWCRDTTLCYLFRMPERYSLTLGSAGFDMLSLANNHFGDFGWPAAKRTKSLLDSLGIYYAGPVEHPYSIFKRDSILYGFCAFSPTAGSVNLTDIKNAEYLVKFLADTCDIVIVSFHGGAEGSDFQRVPRSEEFFYGENRGNVYEFAHRMIDSGADIIFGHGPHVTRGIEVYRDRLICYSLGNFCTYGRFNISGPNGFSPIIKANVDRNGKFLSGRVIPVYQGQDGVVRYDTLRRVIKKIRELTSIDFPETQVSISEKGNIFYK